MTDQDLQQVRAALTVGRERFLDVVGKHGDSILVVALDGTIVYANPATERLLAGPRQGALGSAFPMPVAPNDVVVFDLPGNDGSKLVEMRAIEAQWEGQWAHLVGLSEVPREARPLSSRGGEWGEASAVPTQEDVRDQSARSIVLIADDNIECAQSLAILVRYWGHEPVVVHDGLSALDYAARHQPRAVLLDINLPRLDGFGVATELQSLREEQDFLLIATTGYGDDEDIEHAHAVGFDHFLVKPIDLTVLQTLLSPLRTETD